MNKLSQISLGKGNWFLNFGTAIIIILICFFIYIGLHVKIPCYIEVDVFYHNDSIYLISDKKLNKVEYIYLNRIKKQKINLSLVRKNKYLVSKNSIKQSNLNYLTQSNISKEKIIKSYKNFFDKVFFNN